MTMSLERHSGFARSFAPKIAHRRQFTMLMAAFTGLTGLLVLTATLIASQHESAHSVFSLSNYLGPATRSLEETGHIVIERQAAPYIGAVPFYASRMPFAVYLLMVLHKAFGDHFLWIHLAKTALLFIPCLVCAALALAVSNTDKRNLVFAILLLPFLVPSFLLLAVSLQVEEAYLYSFFSCAIACLFYYRARLLAPWVMMIIFASCIDLTYLTKSSMRVACAVLVAAMLCQIRSVKLRLALCVLTLLAPLGWATYVYEMTGHLTIGSSLDGFNFHKGNYPEFLERYPPTDNGYMDKWDDTIIPSTPMFRSEWEDNDYHLKQGERFLSHPGEFAVALSKKCYVFFFSLRDIGSGHKNDIFAKFDLVNMLLFRTLLLGSMTYCLWNIAHRRHRFVSASYLLVVLTASIPFVLGFALTRHATILIFPSAITVAYFYSRNAGISNPMPGPPIRSSGSIHASELKVDEWPVAERQHG